MTENEGTTATQTNTDDPETVEPETHCLKPPKRQSKNMELGPYAGYLFPGEVFKPPQVC